MPWVVRSLVPEVMCKEPPPQPLESEDLGSMSMLLKGRVRALAWQVGASVRRHEARDEVHEKASCLLKRAQGESDDAVVDKAKLQQARAAFTAAALSALCMLD